MTVARPLTLATPHITFLTVSRIIVIHYDSQDSKPRPLSLKSNESVAYSYGTMVVITSCLSTISPLFVHWIPGTTSSFNGLLVLP